MKKVIIVIIMLILGLAKPLNGDQWQNSTIPGDKNNYVQISIISPEVKETNEIKSDSDRDNDIQSTDNDNIKKDNVIDKTNIEPIFMNEIDTNEYLDNDTAAINASLVQKISTRRRFTDIKKPNKKTLRYKMVQKMLDMSNNIDEYLRTRDRNNETINKNLDENKEKVSFPQTKPPKITRYRIKKQMDKEKKSIKKEDQVIKVPAFNIALDLAFQHGSDKDSTERKPKPLRNTDQTVNNPNTYKRHVYEVPPNPYMDHYYLRDRPNYALDFNGHQYGMATSIRPVSEANHLNPFENRDADGHENYNNFGNIPSFNEPFGSRDKQPVTAPDFIHYTRLLPRMGTKHVCKDCYGHNNNLFDKKNIDFNKVIEKITDSDILTNLTEILIEKLYDKLAGSDIIDSSNFERSGNPNVDSVERIEIIL